MKSPQGARHFTDLALWFETAMANEVAGRGPQVNDLALTGIDKIWPRCLIPDFDGAIFSQAWRDSLWDKFYMGAP
ncbi:hypothetical protein, partial [Rhizobium leguminosarum]|uniref:hypothetical protein n=1 Tax=Rhizobium leguminosarum TaxID=384 RepID=UPI00197CC212